MGGKRRRLQWRLVTWRSTNRGGRCGYSQESCCCIDSSWLVSDCLVPQPTCSALSHDGLCFVLPPIAKRGTGRQAANRRHLSPEAACAETRRHLGRPCDLSSPFRSSLSQRRQQEGGIVWLGCLPPSHITTPSQQGGVLATVCLSVSRLTRNLPDAINLQCNTRIRATNYYTLVLHESVFIAKHTSSPPFPADQSVLSLKEDHVSPKYNTTIHHACSFVSRERLCVSASPHGGY